jgi:hypothetical protein
MTAFVVTRDGEPVWKVACPGCGCIADLDDDQLHGRISTECACGKPEHVGFDRYTHPGAIATDDQGEVQLGCGFHEVRDWFTESHHEVPRDR